MSEATVYIFESEYKAIIAEAQRIPESETGGGLYGTFTHGSMPVVWLASGPGPQALGNKAHFQQDPDFTTYWEARLMENFAVQFLGGWHSHNFLAIIHPSGGDVSTVQSYAKRHERQTSIDIIVTHDQCGNNVYRTTPRPYFYPNAQYGHWVNTKFQVLQGESPLRQLLRAEEQKFSVGISWRSAKEEFVLKRNNYISGSKEYYSHEKAGKFSSDNKSTDSQETELPQDLKLTIEKLHRDGIQVEFYQDGQLLTVVLPVDSQYLLTFVLSRCNLLIKSVSLLIINNSQEIKSEFELNNLLLEEKLISKQQQINYKILKDIRNKLPKFLKVINKSL